MADKVTNEEMVETVETPVTETVEAPKRRRRTKAEIEADNAAAAKAEAEAAEKVAEPEVPADTDKKSLEETTNGPAEAQTAVEPETDKIEKVKKPYEAPIIEEIKNEAPPVIEDASSEADVTAEESEVQYSGILQSPAGIKFYRCPTGERGLLGRIKYRIFIDGKAVGDYVTAHTVFPGTGIVSGYVHKDSIPKK